MKIKKSPGFPALGFVLIAVVATGCSGIHASKSISPLDFILPGLMQNSPSAPATPPATNTVSLLALASPLRWEPEPRPDRIAISYRGNAGGHQETFFERTVRTETVDQNDKPKKDSQNEK